MILEILAIGLLLWCLPTLILEYILKTRLPENQLLLVIGLLGAPWCALRLNGRQAPWWKQRLREICIVAILCLVQTVALAVAHIVSVQFIPALTIQAFIKPLMQITVLNIPLFLGNYSLFLVIRIIGRIWITWNRLRRTQLQWSLTHAHAMVVALGMLILLCVGAVVLLFSMHTSLARLIIPIFALMSIAGVLAVLTVIPPSALFSYIVVRQTVHRIQMLTTATSALRAGNYAVRVPVLGEDEVAQLQTDFNAMAADLERAMADLQQERDTVANLLQSRRELVASASHELRTPVATLRSSLETTLLHWTEHSEQGLKQDFLVMENEVLHLQTLVENLFALARADVGRLSLRSEPTDIGMLARHIVEKYAPLAWQTSKIEVISDVQADVLKALVDSTRVEQILQNLLHHSVRHTAPGGIVALVVGTQDHRVIIQVKNTGEGMTTEELFRIWEQVYQHGGRGNLQDGLGLALVKEWTESMGGQITAENVPGEGCSFCLSFPALIEATLFH
jgi:signal transduction histidine kinase